MTQRQEPELERQREQKEREGTVNWRWSIEAEGSVCRERQRAEDEDPDRRIAVPHFQTVVREPRQILDAQKRHRDDDDHAAHRDRDGDRRESRGRGLTIAELADCGIGGGVPAAATRCQPTNSQTASGATRRESGGRAASSATAKTPGR